MTDHQLSAESRFGFNTLKIHAGYRTGDHLNATSTPIYQSTAFDLESPQRVRDLLAFKQTAATYTRIGNPTVSVLEERVTELDGGAAGVAFASGSAAVFSTLLLLGEGGGNIIAGPTLYGAIQAGLIQFLPRFGVTTKFVHDVNDFSEYESLIDADTRAIYLESLSNPNIEIPDLERIAEIAHRHGVPVVVDNTVATPYLFRPLDHGADIVVYSVTKALSGHGNVLAGLVVDGGRFHYTQERFPLLYERWWKNRAGGDRPLSAVDLVPQIPVAFDLRLNYLAFFGAALGPFDAYLALQGLATLSERLDKQTATAKTVVNYLKSSPHVSWVRYASDEDDPNHDLAARYFPKGIGGLLSFGFDGTPEQEDAFINALELFLYEGNLGDVRSLIVDAPRVTHAELEPRYRDLAHIPDNLVRISVGLEESDDLVNDLDQAFSKVFKD